MSAERNFRLSIRGDASARRWELTERQVKAVVKSCVESQPGTDGHDRRALTRAIQILDGALRGIKQTPEGAASEVERINRIADFLASYAGDEGGFSLETRAEIEAEAEFLRGLTR